ncbi:hypothetical protein GWK47_010432 [Chionoecetes opilio]|uniref:Uncharacterized protein n=1 Tax=Chionoecetes opilio TaxID=41210 RepID=A0A8J5CMQ5_CHIOP|nr:hypothetical protein GWK47_010432 [Chionoecetes opilio]
MLPGRWPELLLSGWCDVGAWCITRGVVVWRQVGPRGSSRAPATCRRHLYAAHAFLHEALKILRHGGVGTQKGWGRGVMFIGDLTSNYRELTGRLVTASPESQLPASGDTEMWREDEGCHTPPHKGLVCHWGYHFPLPPGSPKGVDEWCSIPNPAPPHNPSPSWDHPPLPPPAQTHEIPPLLHPSTPFPLLHHFSPFPTPAPTPEIPPSGPPPGGGWRGSPSTSPPPSTQIPPPAPTIPPPAQSPNPSPLCSIQEGDEGAPFPLLGPQNPTPSTPEPSTPFPLPHPSPRFHLLPPSPPFHLLPPSTKPFQNSPHPSTALPPPPHPQHSTSCPPSQNLPPPHPHQTNPLPPPKPFSPSPPPPNQIPKPPAPSPTIPNPLYPSPPFQPPAPPKPLPPPAPLQEGGWMGSIPPPAHFHTLPPSPHHPPIFTFLGPPQEEVGGWCPIPKIQPPPPPIPTPCSIHPHSTSRPPIRRGGDGWDWGSLSPSPPHPLPFPPPAPSRRWGMVPHSPSCPSAPFYLFPHPKGGGGVERCSIPPPSSNQTPSTSWPPSRRFGGMGAPFPPPRPKPGGGWIWGSIPPPAPSPPSKPPAPSIPLPPPAPLQAGDVTAPGVRPVPERADPGGPKFGGMGAN